MILTVVTHSKLIPINWLLLLVNSYFPLLKFFFFREQRRKKENKSRVDRRANKLSRRRGLACWWDCTRLHASLFRMPQLHMLKYISKTHTRATHLCHTDSCLHDYSNVTFNYKTCIYTVFWSGPTQEAFWQEVYSCIDLYFIQFWIVHFVTSLFLWGKAILGCIWLYSFLF